MIKLTDTQLVVLSAACQRPNRNLLPLPANLKGGAAAKVIDGLSAKGLVEEAAAAPGDSVWREGEDGSRATLRATDAAFQALGIEVERSQSPEEAMPGAKRRSRKGASGPKSTFKAKATNTKAAPSKGSRKPATADESKNDRPSRTNTKQASLIAMLQRPEGASLDEIVAATGWLPHTVRGAIAGALKKKLGLTVTSEKAEGRGRVYRIAG